MQTNPTWANLGVICYEKEFGYSIETISIDTNSCTLSGAWNFEKGIKTNKLKDAELVKQKGYGIAIIDEEDFLRMTT